MHSGYNNMKKRPVQPQVRPNPNMEREVDMESMPEKLLAIDNFW